MDAADKSIRSAVVAGGGIVAWSAAAALRRHFPAVSVNVISSPPPPDALADRTGSTLPSAVDFHHNELGLDEASLVARIGAGFRLGTRFEDWVEGLPDYLHVYGGAPAVPNFHQYLADARRRGRPADLASHSPAAAMAAAGRFAHPSRDRGSPLTGYDYGLQLHPQRYRDYLRAYALHLRATEKAAAVTGVQLRPSDGFIEALTLDDGSTVSADLYVDCTGPAATLRSALDHRFDRWDKWLPCDRLLFQAGTAAETPVPLDRAVALSAGWRWVAPTPFEMRHALVFGSAFLADAKAERVLRGATAIAETEGPVALRQGRRPEPWLRNCVALGDAATAVEPLEAANLHLAHGAIRRLVTMMPDRDFAPVELAEFNRQCGLEADRVRDFLVLHYSTAGRPKHDFWRAAASAPPPPSLAHTIERFRSRGALPYYEEETFSRDSWAAVLLGQGVLPDRIDPVAACAIPAERADRALAAMREQVTALISTLPPYGAYLRQYVTQVRR